MYTKSAHLYDMIYAFKDYAAETKKLHALIQQHKRSPGTALLEVACGTGRYFEPLRQHYTVEGVDVDEGMLAIARQKYPEVVLHHADMVDFDLGRQFDVVACLFNSIGYVKTLERFRQTLREFSRHTAPGGLVLVEPWVRPEQWQVGRVAAAYINQPKLRVSRYTVSQQDGILAVMDLHYLVATPAGVEYFTELHEIALFTDEEYRAAFEDAGLKVIYDPEGPMGYGLYLGLQPLAEGE
jgi:ubiquinone/menaquinone biosynthesis C-methylase UbiE